VCRLENGTLSSSTRFLGTPGTLAQTISLSLSLVKKRDSTRKWRIRERAAAS